MIPNQKFIVLFIFDVLSYQNINTPASYKTFNHVSVRLDGEYPASISRDLIIIPSHEERNASSRNKFILVNVASLVEASSASTYKTENCISNQIYNDQLWEYAMYLLLFPLHIQNNPISGR